MSNTRRTEYRPFTGEAVEVEEMGHRDVDHIEVESFECVICGECQEIEQAATAAPPDCCLTCMDELADAAERERPAPEYRREIA